MTYHSFDLRVYYEDTDLAGIVYYANYLKFIERARSEWVRGLGVDQVQIKSQTGAAFAVRHLEADYLRPAHFDDLLQVRTSVIGATGVRLMLAQEVWHGQDRLFAAKVTLVFIGAAGHALRLPEVLRRALSGLS